MSRISHRVLAVLLTLLFEVGIARSQQRTPPPLFIAYSDNKAYILFVEYSPAVRGILVYRSAGAEFELLTPEPIVPERDPSSFRDMVGNDYEWMKSALKTEDEFQTLRRLEGNPSEGFAFSLASIRVARAIGRMFIDSTAREGRQYTYRIAYLDYDGKEFKRNERTAGMASILPERPAKMNAIAGDGSVSVTWEYAAYTGGTSDLTVGFNIYRSESKDDYVKVNPVVILRQEGPLRRNDVHVKNGKRYSYYVTAVDFIGRESSPSDADTVTPRDATPPIAPAGLRATPAEGIIILDWKMNLEPDISHYNLYRAFSSQSEFLRINPLPIPNTRQTWSDSGVIYGRPYFYRVKAVDSSGNESNFSAAIPARPKDTTPPQMPGNLTANATDTLVRLKWSTPRDSTIAGYYIYRGFTRSSLLRVIGTPLNGDSFRYDDRGFHGKGLWQGKSYFYAVSAIDSAHNESPKAVVLVRIPDHDPPGAPSDPHIELSHNGRVHLRWQPSSSIDVRLYRVFRRLGDGQRKLVAEVHATEWTDSSVEKGRRYSYALVAMDSAGNESLAIEPMSITATSLTVAPSPVGSVVHREGGNVITWSAVNGPEVLGYNLYRSERATGEYSKINAVILSTTTFTDDKGSESSFYKITTVTTSGRENKKGPAISAKRKK